MTGEQAAPYTEVDGREGSGQPPLAVSAAFDCAMSWASAEVGDSRLLVVAGSPQDLALVLPRLQAPVIRASSDTWPAILASGSGSDDAGAIGAREYRAAIWAASGNSGGGAAGAEHTIERCLAPGGLLVMVTRGAGGRLRVSGRRAVRPRLPGQIERRTGIGRPANFAVYALGARLAARAGRPELADRWEAGCRLAASSITRGPALFDVLAFRRA